MPFRIVVGERFRNLAERCDQYIPFTDYANSYERFEAGSDVLFIPGQGLDEQRRELVISRMPNQQVREYLDKGSRKLSCREAHKHNAANILITELEVLSKGHFRTYLNLHNDNELLLDHFSGAHIPGMVILEATRQISIAAWSAYEGKDADDVAMVINDIHCEYKKFAFPFCLPIDVRLSKLSEEEYELTVEFLQNDEVVALTYGTFKALSKEKIEKLESILLKKITNARKRYFLETFAESA